MNKKSSNTIILMIVLVIVALAAGIGIGFLLGRTYSETKESTSGSETILESVPEIETVKETESESEIEAETEEDDSVPVLSVNGRVVTLNEINVRLYTLRSHYVEIYGEEPWGEITENGQTVSEEAKAQLEADVIRAELCMEKAADYGIVVSDDVIAMNRQEAQNFLDSIGTDIAAQFGLTLTAVQNVYIKYSVITEVTNALDDQIRSELLADEANQGLSDAELEVKISEASQQIMNTWREEATISYEDVWEQIVVGSVG